MPDGIGSVTRQEAAVTAIRSAEVVKARRTLAAGSASFAAGVGQSGAARDVVSTHVYSGDSIRQDMVFAFSTGGTGSHASARDTMRRRIQYARNPRACRDPGK
jgi:hypothetical protein